jgi:hypothetical protein
MQYPPESQTLRWESLPGTLRFLAIS